MARQADEARQAISRAAGLIGKDLSAAMDPRLWTREHPWAALGMAAAGGFAAAAAVTPTQQEAAVKRLARLERVLSAHASVDGEPEADSKGKPRKGLGQRLMRIGVRQALKVLQPMVISAITGAATGRASSDNAASRGVYDPSEGAAEI